MLIEPVQWVMILICGVIAAVIVGLVCRFIMWLSYKREEYLIKKYSKGKEK